ncbi:D-alanine--D-alanine ligase family protein [Carnobacterium sp.]|uniref:D-alanine--D-alanine ligase family protein n=1 Tax=Carnobacterium sp. TaxID=48221 RepID=UPI002FC788E8
MNKKINVGVVFGGKSTEYHVSLQSAKNILESLDRDKYSVHLFAFSNEGALLNFDESEQLLIGDGETVNNHGNETTLSHLISQPFNNQANEIDVYFPILHGNLGEDGSIQGFFRLLNKPFVGSSVLSSALCMDKDFSKQVLNYNGFKTAKSITVKTGEIAPNLVSQVENELGFPVFIKPANQGSSVGVSRAVDQISFKKGLIEAFKYDSKIIIEEELIGKEVECAVLGNENPLASNLGSISTDESNFYSYEEKYLDESGAVLEIPAKISEESTLKIKKLALAAYKLLECKGLARIDFFLTNQEEIYINEVNTLPGFTNISMYPQLWQASGISYGGLVERLIQLALEEFAKEAKIQRKIDLNQVN